MSIGSSRVYATIASGASLQEAGKLVDARFPAFMKGYEIYSWQTGTQNWNLTLITGTDRNKSCKKITTYSVWNCRGLRPSENELKGYTWQ